ncbi:hypothetical protein [Mesorhizobium huakuii]|uniref:Uncharacterized protein n=1 Tax=Mesorhizobium huakuii TaxID=28104 RepID=A0ABZ0VWN3_9HYPH|nr:hypothetical protein [Mesorhizobium huakuii]WQC01404.1 hypothetical protein U0R22_005622 [Mesorhizobium huakuii]
MQYETGRTIRVGDEVIADGMKGVVVCDFDNREFAEGYEGWDMPGIEMLGGGTLSSGVMVETIEAGMIHYVHGSGVIDLIQSAAR